MLFKNLKVYDTFMRNGIGHIKLPKTKTENAVSALGPVLLKSRTVVERAEFNHTYPIPETKAVVK